MLSKIFEIQYSVRSGNLEIKVMSIFRKKKNRQRNIRVSATNPDKSP